MHSVVNNFSCTPEYDTVVSKRVICTQYHCNIYQSCVCTPTYIIHLFHYDYTGSAVSL